MRSYEISVYIKAIFIRKIWGDFKTKKQALEWTLNIYKSIGFVLDPKEITIVDRLK